MIERVRLIRYKGFEGFSLQLPQQAYLVGPNNAGKTTLAQALRLSAACLRHARRRNAADGFSDDTFHQGSPRWVQGFPLASVAAREISWYQDENLRHEFRELSAGLELSFKGGGKLRIVWPVDETAFFYVEKAEGIVARTTTVVNSCAPTFGVVPTLGPVEHREEVLTASYVKESIGTRRTSRHFRNQLFHLRAASGARFKYAVAFILEHTPELTALALRDVYGPGTHELDLYVTEAATHTEKEIFWLGDGLQVWLQVLFHTWLNLDTESLVLDEPDVFLHPDLQRRLVSMLDDLDRQVIVATHAPEILAEANRDAVVWVDRTRRHSRRAKDSGDLTRLNETLGSGFNLGMARALRARSVLFVEGDDMKILRNIARAVGATRIRQEKGLAVIPLQGFSNWHQVEPFAWLSRNLLGNAINIFVVLDRDYRSESVVQNLLDSLSGSQLRAHVWRRKELESYLLTESAVARVLGCSLDEATRLLAAAINTTKNDAQAAYCAQQQRDAARGTDPQTVLREALPKFEAGWSSPTERIELIPPKLAISALSRLSQGEGGRPVSARVLSARILLDDVADEVRRLLTDIEATL